MADHDDANEGTGEIEVKCPACGAVVRISEAKAEREMKAVCPKGHEIPLARALG